MNLVINNTPISTDSDGRFSLNDLHDAAGGGNDKKPSLFYRSDNFKKAVEVLKAQNRAFEPIVKKQGRYTGGTWVCKELVYKYAMWVSAEFEVSVIQTFDKAVNNQLPISSMDALNALTKKIESDKDVASFCESELARYRKFKKENEERFLQEVSTVQMNLGFSEVEKWLAQTILKLKS